jgi:hypothetical protein
MLPKSQNWILMLALFLTAPAMRSLITVPRNQSRDDRETLARFSFLIRSKRAIASVIAPSGHRRLVSC